MLRVKVRGQRDLVTVVGAAATITAGEFVQASGNWVNDCTQGVQFRAAFLRAAPPTTLEGIERYLGSGMIKGIGPVYGGKLVRAFGEAVFDVIEQQPGRLREVAGIGPKRAERIVAGWADQRVIREIMLFGIEPTAMIRARAGISYALAEAMDEGHCGLPLDELVPLAETLLEIPAATVEATLELELQDGAVVADTIEDRPCVFLAGPHRAERAIAARLRVLADGELPWPAIDAEKANPLG